MKKYKELIIFILITVFCLGAFISIWLSIRSKYDIESYVNEAKNITENTSKTSIEPHTDDSKEFLDKDVEENKLASNISCEASDGMYIQTLVDGSKICMQQQGVYYCNGIKYTYYSSNVLYHYRTPEWELGCDGLWRTKDGLLVVASSDYEQGAILDTPFGEAQVLDSGCASGIIDLYCAF